MTFERITLALAVAAAFTLAAPARADEALAKKHNCLACHQIDKKSVGPAYKDIAKKYKGQNVAAKLEEKVKKGGAGVWGQVPMAPNPAVPDADIKKLVAWILAM
ncbi:MAG TPA: c-type cytochrome [Burkholderiales bacterium]|nr:c-type cytochrome [Burkholderiales bacterium]